MSAVADKIEKKEPDLTHEREPIALEDLVDLARDRSISSRNQLVETLGDLYLDGEQPVGDSERDLMTDILHRLIRDVEMAVRQRLAERLAVEPDAPRELVTTLANDAIEVAHPILVASEALEDSELIEIVRHRTMQHRQAIATRQEVAENVSDALVDSGDVNVIETLIRNQGASIAPEALAALVEASKNIEVYQKPLVARSDLTPRLAKQMYWWVSAALRKHIATNYEIDSTELDSKIVSTVQDILGVRESVDLPADGLDELARKLADRGAVTTRLLIESLRQREVSLFEALFARLVGLKKSLVRRFIFESGGECLAIACKAANIYKADFTTIFLLSRSARPGEKLVDPNELSRAVAFYDRITSDTARKVVQRWHLDPDYLDALKKMHGKRKRPRRTATAG